MKATAAFMGGILVVLLGWPLIGMIIETYGFILLFGLVHDLMSSVSNETDKNLLFSQDCHPILVANIWCFKRLNRSFAVAFCLLLLTSCGEFLLLEPYSVCQELAR